MTTIKIKCYLSEQHDNRRKYIIDVYDDISHITHGYGYIVAEKYDDVWNIELMHVIPQREGYGTILLKYSLDDMKKFTNKVVVNPITNEGRNFFKKNGFDENWSLMI